MIRHFVYEVSTYLRIDFRCKCAKKFYLSKSSKSEIKLDWKSEIANTYFFAELGPPSCFDEFILRLIIILTIRRFSMKLYKNPSFKGLQIHKQTCSQITLDSVDYKLQIINTYFFAELSHGATFVFWRVFPCFIKGAWNSKINIEGHN